MWHQHQLQARVHQQREEKLWLVNSYSSILPIWFRYEWDSFPPHHLTKVAETYRICNWDSPGGEPRSIFDLSNCLNYYFCSNFPKTNSILFQETSLEVIKAYLKILQHPSCSSFCQNWSFNMTKSQIYSALFLGVPFVEFWLIIHPSALLNTKSCMVTDLSFCFKTQLSTQGQRTSQGWTLH